MSETFPVDSKYKTYTEFYRNEIKPREEHQGMNIRVGGEPSLYSSKEKGLRIKAATDNPQKNISARNIKFNAARKMIEELVNKEFASLTIGGRTMGARIFHNLGTHLDENDDKELTSFDASEVLELNENIRSQIYGAYRHKPGLTEQESFYLAQRHVAQFDVNLGEEGAVQRLEQSKRAVSAYQKVRQTLVKDLMTTPSSVRETAYATLNVKQGEVVYEKPVENSNALPSHNHPLAIRRLADEIMKRALIQNTERLSSLTPSDVNLCIGQMRELGFQTAEMSDLHARYVKEQGDFGTQEENNAWTAPNYGEFESAGSKNSKKERVISDRITQDQNFGGHYHHVGNNSQHEIIRDDLSEASDNSELFGVHETAEDSKNPGNEMFVRQKNNEHSSPKGTLSDDTGEANATGAGVINDPEIPAHEEVDGPVDIGGVAAESTNNHEPLNTPQPPEGGYEVDDKID